MKTVTPEQKGISSRSILAYIQLLEEQNLSTHDLIIMRGDDVIFEHYWQPFHKDFLHRMYSTTKSFVSLAVGFLEQDGLICLDDKISKYFAKELQIQPDLNMHNQTIRHMLMMSTTKGSQDWFTRGGDDRVQFYFANDDKKTRAPGTFFEYDSTGSFVLGALVERLTGKELITYLREKLFDKIGVSKEAYCLRCPGGHAWGDSGLLCKATDLLKVARFVMNGGSWNGEQILNRDYVTAAVSKQIDNDPFDENRYNTQGYGYQFWRTKMNGFAFIGMGCQLAICLPDQDLIMVYNGDNQGRGAAYDIIFEGFFHLAATAQDAPLSEDVKAQQELAAYTKSLRLAVARGEKISAKAQEISGVTYLLQDNPMGIRQLRLDFAADGTRGELVYTNAQGEKHLPFGMGENVFGPFPQEGYSDEMGAVPCPGNFYHCAASAAWTLPHKLHIMVQVIDKYFGRLDINLCFTGDGITVKMDKVAEAFMNEYFGSASGTAI